VKGFEPKSCVAFSPIAKLELGAPRVIQNDLLNAEAATGVTLTENFAMNPAASVCCLYFASPASKYFVLGKIGKDQVEDYANRKGIEVDEAEKWLAPVLNYDPS
jgi:5-methyltetrahydrofolate--homocysteine methyltransferase